MGQVNIEVFYYYASKFVLGDHDREFINTTLQCINVRLFFPDLLPTTLRQILYLDTDIIVTGNLLHIWQNAKRLVVGSSKLAAMVQDSEIFDDIYVSTFEQYFGHFPHVPPRGVNAAVMFMNLQAMREFKWTARMHSVLNEWGEFNDQEVINILFHSNLDRLAMLPCQYNFHSTGHCATGFTCRNLTSDPGGIYMLHGSGSSFEGIFADIYEAFREVE